MRRIAGEFNQSETTFILRPTLAQADWHLRSFTATRTEVAAIGHNGLGVWWWLAETGRLAKRDTATNFQQIGAGVLPVQVRYNGDRLRSIVIEQSEPAFGAVLENLDPLAMGLSLELDDLRVGKLLPASRLDRRPAFNGSSPQPCSDRSCGSQE